MNAQPEVTNATCYLAALFLSPFMPWLDLQPHFLTWFGHLCPPALPLPSICQLLPAPSPDATCALGEVADAMLQQVEACDHNCASQQWFWLRVLLWHGNLIELQNEHSWSELVCEICSRAEDEENMIICDACDLGYHLQCLGDTDSANDLDFNILEDDWTCGACDASGDDSEAVFLSYFENNYCAISMPSRCHFRHTHFPSWWHDATVATCGLWPLASLKFNGPWSTH